MCWTILRFNAFDKLIHNSPNEIRNFRSDTHTRALKKKSKQYAQKLN